MTNIVGQISNSLIACKVYHSLIGFTSAAKISNLWRPAVTVVRVVRAQQLDSVAQLVRVAGPQVQCLPVVPCVQENARVFTNLLQVYGKPIITNNGNSSVCTLIVIQGKSLETIQKPFNDTAHVRFQ